MSSLAETIFYTGAAVLWALLMGAMIWLLVWLDTRGPHDEGH